MEPVQVERFYLGCLAHASYMVGSGGVAAVIDPQRDVDIYLEAAARKAKLFAPDRVAPRVEEVWKRVLGR